MLVLGREVTYVCVTITYAICLSHTSLTSCCLMIKLEEEVIDILMHS